MAKVDTANRISGFAEVGFRRKLLSCYKESLQHCTIVSLIVSLLLGDQQWPDIGDAEVWFLGLCFEAESAQDFKAGIACTSGI